MADIVLWRPTHFGIKASFVIKSGFVAWAVSGDAAASLSTCDPLIARPQWGAHGRAPQGLSVNFVHPRAIEADVAGRLGLAKPLLPVSGTRTLGKRDMLHNDLCPEIRVDAQTFDVYVDGELAWCEPLERVALGQRYMLR